VGHNKLMIKFATPRRKSNSGFVRGNAFAFQPVGKNLNYKSLAVLFKGFSKITFAF